MSSEYRPEIDGLRAFAVVPVVLFHAGVPGFSGGYVGVDVFFVISGFLITGILLRSVQTDRFSLLQFYERRIRRIFPALFAVLAATTVCAVCLLFPRELTNFGKSLFATSLFYANYHFMHDTAYFAAPADSKPLLHMWSLAVEEQFYLLFPVYLYAVWRWLRPWLLTLTLALSALSLGYSIWLMANAPDQAFYSAPARAWELMLGSLLAMFISQRPAHSLLTPHRASALTLLGLALICGPVVLYSESTAFPGAMAIPPVLGSALVLWATQTTGNRAAGLLSMPPLRFVRLISYSLYLWHWPVFVLYKIYAIEPLTGTQTMSMLAAVLGLAILSWRFIERPFRLGGRVSSRTKVVGAGVATMVVGLSVGAAMALGDGLPRRFSSEVHRLLAVRDDAPSAADCRPLAADSAPRVRLCALGVLTGVAPTFVVWGDSHAEALLPAISAAARQAGVSGLAYVRGGCPALAGVAQARDGYRDCDETAESFMKFVADQPQLERVVLISRWAIYAMGHRFGAELGHTVYITDDDATTPSIATNQAVFERGVARTLGWITRLGRQATVVSQVPETEYSIPLTMARAAHLDRPVDLGPTRQDYLARQATVEATFARQLPNSQVVILRPERVLCAQEACPVAADGIPLYRDSNHLTRTSALALAGLFRPLFSGTGE